MFTSSGVFLLQGLNDLYDFKLRYPEADLEPFLKKSSPIFQNYIERGLKNIEAERALASSTTSGSTTTGHMKTSLSAPTSTYRKLDSCTRFIQSVLVLSTSHTCLCYHSCSVMSTSILAHLQVWMILLQWSGEGSTVQIIFKGKE